MADRGSASRTMSNRHLRGDAASVRADNATVALLRQSQRRRRATAGSSLARVRTLAADPHLHAMAAAVTDGNRRDHRIGGRPSAYPDWCLLVFGACIRIFGSASATARALADQALWADVIATAQPLLAGESRAPLPVVGPNRDHWGYFCKHRVTPKVLQELLHLHRDLAVARAREVGLLNPADSYPAGRYTRDHVVGIDGKVFDSPVRTLDTERVDKATGLIRPVRQDPGRERYGEAGTEGLV